MNGPDLDQNPRLQITFVPRLARFVRMTNLANPEDPEEPWTIAELFIYEVSPAPLKPSEKAVEAYHQANRALDHWMDDPTGPHPLFPGVNLEDTTEAGQLAGRNLFPGRGYSRSPGLGGCPSTFRGGH